MDKHRAHPDLCTLSVHDSLFLVLSTGLVHLACRTLRHRLRATTGNEASRAPVLTKHKNAEPYKNGENSDRPLLPRVRGWSLWTPFYRSCSNSAFFPKYYCRQVSRQVRTHATSSHPPIPRHRRYTLRARGEANGFLFPASREKERESPTTCLAHYTDRSQATERSATASEERLFLSLGTCVRRERERAKWELHHEQRKTATQS